MQSALFFETNAVAEGVSERERKLEMKFPQLCGTHFSEIGNKLLSTNQIAM